MAGLFYTVDLSRDERMARNPKLVDTFLVKLCQEHCPDNWHETDCESLAIATALKALEHRYSPDKLHLTDTNAEIRVFMKDSDFTRAARSIANPMRPFELREPGGVPMALVEMIKAVTAE